MIGDKKDAFMKKYAQIIIEISVKSLEKIFTYGIPEEMQATLSIGSVVEIPFGAGNRQIKGYVLGLTNTLDFDAKKIKYIIKQDTSIGIESELIQLALWMKERYATTLQAALKSLMPMKSSVRRKEEKYVKLILGKEELVEYRQKLVGNTRFIGRLRALDLLEKEGYIEMKTLLRLAKISRNIVTTLIKTEVVVLKRQKVNRLPYSVEDYTVTSNLALNSTQQIAKKAILEGMAQVGSPIFLLHGITGSGKTEVYMQAIEEVLKKGASAIVMIPEIALTPLMVRRFVERFGPVVGVLHSRLSAGEKFDQWQMAKTGNIKIMIGPRSVIFTPFERIGLIVMDEAHEMTYKSEKPPKYHAREVAIYRANYHKCPVILGSATPLVTTYYKALLGKYTLLTLPIKAAAKNPLQVDVVDMREELKEGNHSIISRKLYKAIEERLARKEQIILFLNRRGYAGFISCRECGFVLKCQHCEVSYHYHRHTQTLSCHYCGHKEPMVSKCPSCGSKHIRSFGIGTQKVEAYIKKVFKEARVIRMDYDTTTGKDGHKKLLDQFEQHKGDILIGTQMVAKGHHFDQVTLVGVVAADMSLYMNDFRASERTFQLITQVTGRSGRGSKSGQAIIQTYSPGHYSLLAAKEQNYQAFYKNEIAYRELLNYPPFSHILTVLITARDESYVIDLSYRLKKELDKHGKGNQLTILGPAPATISKVKDVYRQVIYIKSKSYRVLTQLVAYLYDIIKEVDERHIGYLHTDINSMMSY